MIDQPRLKIIKDNPIGKGLDAFRVSFNLICEGASIPCTLDALVQLEYEDIQNLALDLFSVLRNLPTIRLLRSKSGHCTLRNDLLKLISVAASDDFDLDCIKPLLNAALADDPDDALIWDQVYLAVTESTPPPQPVASSFQQTPWRQSTGSFANSSEYRKDVDKVLREELGVMYVGLLRFHETFFRAIPGLESAYKAVFKKCMEGDNPLFGGGWRGWPEDANQDRVLSWFAGLSEQLWDLANEHKSTTTLRRRPLAQPNKPIQGSTAERKLDIGFVNDPDARKDSRYHWSQILVPGELKSNPSADTASKAWLNIGRYAREVLAAQDTRRFVLGFTLCGSLMRIWEFDRLGGIASEQFDINKDGLQFVSTVLGFLWMNEEELGFDPTFMTVNGQRFIEIERNGSKERLIIDKVMHRTRCIAGRATTCWKAHREEDPQKPFVIKDSWQYQERDEEGDLLREATGKGVVKVARYYHHSTVQIGGMDDDIQSNVRGGLDVTRATNYRPERSMPPSSMIASSASRKGRSGSIAGKKRSSSQTGAPLPRSKRSCSASPTKASSDALPNRIHRRTITLDYGKPIYEASSRSALVAALEGCIEGHESLRKAGFLHRDISINNLRINEDDNNPSWPSFLIDFDLSIKEQRGGVSGARGKTGTRAFMAIGALLGEQHSFMHDLESFFWVLFWICIHCKGPDESRVVKQFDKWNYVDTEELAKQKLGTVAKEAIFMKTITDNFTPYCEPLIPLSNKLRKVVFPRDRPWEREDEKLYSQMRETLQKWEDLQ
ncbi:hypothetical protein B0T17DRAFT_491041 [Bombardia bombarda]|uniref:Fungal-type protein kinase domain-containing protein n=1 Tax=Bombardia bombarda TaxID=252184 RepID=A0AA40C7J9_9PEZI|nr:hypothetical protein B0T17DRAFT_491041 [Bombardia bombarda]